MKDPQTVLLVDDDQWLTAQFTRLLKKSGFNVITAGHALDGMHVIDQQKPSVIVLDMFMPGPNGVVLLHELRSHSDLAKIPVIVCTNSASDIPKGDLSHYGVSMILDKTTMHPDDIVAAVKRVLA